MYFVRGFYGESMINLITRMVSVRLCGDNVEKNTFCGDFMVILVWRLSGIFLEETW